MANEQHKWTFPKFWKSSKRDSVAAEGGVNHDAHGHGSGSTPTPQERSRFQLRKSSSQSSVFQTRRNSRPSAERVTEDNANDPEWVPFHRSLSPGLKSKDNTSVAASPVVDALQMGNSQNALVIGDQRNSPLKLGSSESKGMSTAPGLTSDNQRSYLAGQNMSPRNPASNGWKQRERADADKWESGGNRLCHNVGSPNMSPKAGDNAFKNAHQGAVSRRLFPANSGQRRERPYSENVLASTPIRDYPVEMNDGQSDAVQQRRDEGDDTTWEMHRQANNDGAVCRTGIAGSQLQDKRVYDDVVQTGESNRQLFAMKVGGEAIKERSRTVGGPAEHSKNGEVKQAKIGHCLPQQDRTEKFNYVQVDHASPQSGQHLDRSNKLALIGQCNKGDMNTGNEEVWSPEDQVERGFVMSSSSAAIPGVDSRNVDSRQNDDAKIGSTHAVTDFRSSGVARCFPEGSDGPIPCQMATVAAQGDVRGDYSVGIVHGNSAAGSYQKPDAQTMDVYGSRRARQPWERNKIPPRSMVAESPDRGVPFAQQRYQESSQMHGNYQGSFPQQRSVCFDEEKQFHGMTSSPVVTFNKGVPAAEQHTGAALSYRWLVQNEATPDRYDEKIPLEVGFANVKRRTTPVFSQTTVGNKSHIPTKQLWNKPLEAHGTAVCRSPQDPCTVSTTSQDSGFEQRLQHNLDSQNQSQMSSILESSINTPPIFVSGDSGDVKEYYGHRQRSTVETSRHHTEQVPWLPRDEGKHHRRSREFIDYSSEDSNSDGSSDLFVPKTRSQYDLTKAHAHGNRKTTTRASLRAKSHNNVWPRLDNLSASDGEAQSVAKSSLVLLHSTDDFITAVDRSHGDHHHDTDRKSSHRRHGSKTARQEQIRKFKSVENVVSAKHAKRNSVFRLSEGNDGRRTKCDHRDMDLRGDVTFDGKFINIIDSYCLDSR